MPKFVIAYRPFDERTTELKLDLNSDGDGAYEYWDDIDEALCALKKIRNLCEHDAILLSVIED